MSNFDYNIYYVFSFFVFILFIIIIPILFKNKKNYFSKFLEIVAIIIFIIIAINKPIDIIPDSETYLTTYNLLEIKSYGFNPLIREPNTSMEYGYVYLMMSFKLLNLDYNIFYLVIILFIGISFYNFAKYSYFQIELKTNESSYNNQLGYFLCSFFIYFGLFYNFITLRSFLSMAFLTYTFIFSTKKKYFISSLFLLLAFFIHRLAIIGFIFFILGFIKTNNISLIKIKSCFFISFIIFLIEWKTNFLLNHVFGIFYEIINVLQYRSYTTKGIEETSIARFIYVLLYFILGFIYYSHFKNYLKDNHNSYLKRLVIIYLIGLIIASFLCKMPQSFRVFDYLMIVSIPINYYLLKSKKFVNNLGNYFCWFSIQLMFTLIAFRSFLMFYLIELRK